jgi:hypothetical protein
VAVTVTGAGGSERTGAVINLLGPRGGHIGVDVGELFQNCGDLGAEKGE